MSDQTEESPVGEPTERVPFMDAIAGALNGPDGVKHARTSRERNAELLELAHTNAVTAALAEATEIAANAAHRRAIRRASEREAAGRARQQQVIAWLIGLISAELLVLLPLMVWGLFTGEVWL